MVHASNVVLEELLEPAVVALGLELVGSELVARSGSSLLRVYIDSPNGVSIDDCERVSKQIAAILDVEDPIKGKYLLEVSSPGLDRPLFKLAHYTQFIGAMVKLKLAAPINNRRNFVGQLMAVDGQKIELLVDNKTVNLDFSQIEKANVIAEF